MRRFASNVLAIQHNTDSKKKSPTFDHNYRVSQIQTGIFRKRIPLVVGSKKSIYNLGQFSLVSELWRAEKKINFHGAFWRPLEWNLLVSEVDEKPKITMYSNRATRIRNTLAPLPVGTKLWMPENGP